MPPNFKYFSQKVLKDFYMLFYDSKTQGPLGGAILDPMAFILTSLIKDYWQSQKQNFKHLRQVVLKKIF